MINRDERIYRHAIDGTSISYLNPTEEEIKRYNRMRKEIIETNAKAKAEGRKIIWEIPFDP